jgi:hypothetical protein
MSPSGETNTAGVVDANTVTEVADVVSALVGRAGVSPTLRALARPLLEKALGQMLSNKPVAAKIEAIKKIGEGFALLHAALSD